MSRLMRAVAALVFVALLSLLTLSSPADAATHAPCISHTAVAPYVSRVDDGVTTLSGAGGIGGCPAPVEWTSAIVTFTPGDSGVCGSYGGGD